VTLRERAAKAVDDLARAVEDIDYAGYDPYDALASPLLRAAVRTPLARRAAIQTLKRSPVNLRPLFGVPKLRHAKGLALFASACARRAEGDPGSPFADRARSLCAALRERTISVPSGAGWGYDFDVQTRWGFYRCGEPNAVVTAFAAGALLDLAELDGPDHDRGLLERVVGYATGDLLLEEGGEQYFAYFAGSRRPIHNANLLVAAVCARAGAPAVAQKPLRFSLERQRADGTWPYGEGRGLGWVDGFHTAYVLDALRALSNDPAAEAALRSGLDVYLERLIDPDGGARATVERRHPIDIHAAASAIGTLSDLAGRDSRALPKASSVLSWTLTHMRRRDGRFAFQRHRLHRKATPFVRWSDGHMALGLARYLRATE
jgi:hypothetical protein